MEGMRSYKLVHFGEALQEICDSLPTPVGTQVLIRTRACGVCHSDLHVADGHFDLGRGQSMDLSRGIALPRTLGHEIAGEVVSCGPEASGLERGLKCVVYPWGGCGKCRLCDEGREHLCNRPRNHGLTLDGGYGEYVLVDHPRYLQPIGDLPDAFAATLACAGLTAYSALRKADNLGKDSPPLIIGAGGVGSAAINLVQVMYGVAPAVADIDPAKRQAALNAGAACVVDPADVEGRKRLLKETGGGFSAVLDFVGAAATVEYGLSMVAKGGRLVLVGLFGGAIDLPLPTVPTRGISLIGSYVGSLTEFGELVDLARHGKLPRLALQSRPLEQAQQSLDDLRAGRVLGRIVLVP